MDGWIDKALVGIVVLGVVMALVLLGPALAAFGYLIYRIFTG